MKTTWSTLWHSIEKHSPRAVLFYGNDSDSLSFRVKQYASHAFRGYKIQELKAQDVIKDPSILECLNTSGDLFSSSIQSVVIITQATNSLLKPLDTVLEKGLDMPIFVWSSKLKKDSKLRLYFEAHGTLQSVPTYEPDQEGFKSYLIYLLRKHALKVEKSVPELIGAILSWNSSFLETFVQKISWFCKNKETVTANQVWSCSPLPDPEIEKFLKAFLVKDKKTFTNLLDLWEKTEGIQNIYFISFYLWKLLEIKQLVCSGISINQAIYKLRPILPPHINTMLIQAAGKWHEKELQILAAKLLKGEKNLKTGEQENFHTARDLLMLVSR